MRIICFYLFLVLNLLNLQYVPGLRKINNYLTSMRMFLLRLSGANISPSAILRPNCIVLYPKKLEVGSDTVIGSGARIMNFAEVFIGRDAEIGPNLVLQTNEHRIDEYDKPLGKQGAEYKPISIGEGCYIGGDVTILSGVNITKNCLIGAKSLVVKDITKPGVYAGCPAKLVKKFPCK